MKSSIFVGRSFFPASLLQLLVAAAPALGQTFTFTGDELLVVASAAPGSSFIGGVGNTSLTIDQDSNDFGGPGVSHGLLRFTDFQSPAEAVVRSARLEFFTTSATTGPVDVYGMTVDWTTATTWSSLGGDGLTPGVETLAVPGGSQIDIVEGMSVSFDVTSIVAEWLRGTPNFGFGVINQSGDGWDIRTADSPDGLELAPRLVVEFTSPPPLTLEVDPATGYGRFLTDVGSDVASVRLTSYEISSSGAPLDVAAWEASNLAAGGVDAIDPAAEGQRWEVVGGTPQKLIESYLLGGSDLVEGEILPLGALLPPGTGSTTLAVSYIVDVDFVDPAINDQRDVLFVEDVRVEFRDVPRAGDYTGDGAIDAADYTAWRDQLGAVGPTLAADGNRNRVVDATDFQLWRANYGAAVAPPASGRATPEPSAALALAVGVATAAGVAVRRS